MYTIEKEHKRYAVPETKDELLELIEEICNSEPSTLEEAKIIIDSIREGIKESEFLGDEVKRRN